MKKFIYSAMAVAMLATTSCKDDLAESFVGDQATVEFSISTPEIATRAYSDGATATHLQYAVYKADGKILSDLTNTQDEIHGSTTVDLKLTTGNTYTVVFWAAAPNAPYTVDFGSTLDAAKMDVTYTNATSNDEKRDAFYAVKEFTVNGAMSVDVDLNRPFAQINIGTSDYAASKSAGYTPTQSAVTVKGLGTTFNFKSGKVSGEAEARVFGEALIDKNETFPVAGYEYLAMNYVLVNNVKSLVDVEFTYSDANGDAKTRTVGSVPVQRNYRTNIYGNLLTSEVDINIEIKPEYNEPDYDIYHVVVDGVSYTDFAEAAAKAMELNKPIEFIENVAIDADNTITVENGETLTLNLNGHVLSGVTDQVDKNREMFLVKGSMNVNNGVVTVRHDGDNMGWNKMTTVFDVTAGGVLNTNNATIENYGGSDMGFCVHMNNWGEVTLNAQNTTFNSNYVAVRVFNSGYDKNNVTIKNSTLKGGSYAFWVHNYTTADFGSETKAESQKALLKFDVFNGTNKFIGKNDTPIRYGMTNAEYLDNCGNKTIEVASATDLKNALEKGESAILTADVDFGTNQLALTNANLDLNGHTLKTNMSYGGIALKNGASIVNGTIEHTSTVAAIKAFNVGSIENVTIKTTCAVDNKTITAIAVQQGGYVGLIKNVTIEGVSQGIEVGYQATVDLIENVVVEEHTNGTANGIGLVINGGKVGKAKNCTFKGDVYGVTMHLKGVFAVGLELENCKVEGTIASIYAWDEKGISNTSGSLVLTYDAATTLTGPFVWDFEDECKSVVTLNQPQ